MTHSSWSASALASLLFACLTPAAHGYAFLKIADTDTPAPAGAFYNMGLPAVSNGLIAFRSPYNISGPTGVGIFLGSGGPLTPAILQEGFITNINSEPLVANGQAHYLTFIGQLGLARSNSHPLITSIVQVGSPSSIGTITGLESFDVSGANVAFRGFADPNRTAAFQKTGSSTTLIAKDGDAAPSGTFYNIGKVAVDNNVVAFVGNYEPNMMGIFTGQGGPISTIVKRGDAAPTGVFEHVRDPQIDDNVVAYAASYGAGGNIQGLVKTTGGVHAEIVAVGDAAPTGTFFSVGDFSLSGAQVAFQGYYNLSESGIFVGDGGALSTVIKMGDPLFGSTVTGVGFGRGGLDSDGTGRIAFQYGLANGRGGIAVALIPEPGAFVLLALAAVGCLARRRRQSHQM